MRPPTRRSSRMRWRRARSTPTSSDSGTSPGMSATQVAAQRGKAQISAPMMAFDEEDDIYLTLTNLGLLQRPGPVRRTHPALARLRQRHPALRRCSGALPRGAGRPRSDVLLPPARRRNIHVPLPFRGRRARADGHDRNGLRPARSRTRRRSTAIRSAPSTPTTTATDPPATTGSSRSWSPNCGPRRIIGTRTSRSTTGRISTPVSGCSTAGPTRTPSPANGDPNSTAAGRLQYQPISSLITCNTGERVLLRLSNLGYQNHAMSVDNIDLQIVAKDASLLKGRDGTTNYITTNTVDIGPGESRDVIFTAPAAGHLPAVRPQILLSGERRRSRIRRNDDRDHVAAAGTLSRPDCREHLTGTRKSP